MRGKFLELVWKLPQDPRARERRDTRFSGRSQFQNCDDRLGNPRASWETSAVLQRQQQKRSSHLTAASRGDSKSKSLNGVSIGVLPVGIKHSSSFAVEDRRLSRPGSSMEKRPGAQLKKQSVAEDERIRRAADSKKADFSGDPNNSLHQLVVEAGIASNRENATNRLEVNSMLKKNNYKVQVALGEPNSP